MRHAGALVTGPLDARKNIARKNTLKYAHKRLGIKTPPYILLSNFMNAAIVQLKIIRHITVGQTANNAFFVEIRGIV